MDRWGDEVELAPGDDRHQSRRPILLSNFAFDNSSVRFLVLAILAAIAVATVQCDLPGEAVVAGVFASSLLLQEMNRILRWRCPHCRRRSLRATGSGGIYYDDGVEERVFWGECISCGKCSIRRNPICGRWKRYPDTDPTNSPGAGP
jgi:hypothetical protein